MQKMKGLQQKSIDVRKDKISAFLLTDKEIGCG
jgi:hypothetical protein